jgi:hypothetical protein
MVLNMLQTEIQMKHADQIRRTSSRAWQQSLNINVISSRRTRSRTPTPGPSYCVLGSTSQMLRRYGGEKEENSSTLEKMFQMSQRRAES